MCTHLRRITNKYTGETMFVKCGYCKACLQEKANMRKQRIESEYNPEFVPLFVTLTYDRFSCPYVYLDDILQKKEKLPLYRAHTVRVVPCKERGSVVYRARRTYEETKLASFICPDYRSIYRREFKCLKNFGKRVGICYYEDVKNFIKRLRINLQRNYNYVFPFKFYSCSEYGPQTERPHFHLLLFIRRGDDEIFRECICKSWPFAYKHRTKKYIQVAENAASYVATYVNCNTSIHPFLSQNFKCKHSYSKYFGFGNEQYSLPTLLEMLRRCDMSYYVRYSGKESGLSPIPCPKYVINRYFPLFKGFSSLSYDEILQFILHPQGNVSIIYDGSRLSLNGYYKVPTSTKKLRLHEPTLYASEKVIEYSPADLHKISVRLDNAYHYYNKITGRGRLDYARDFFDIWQCWKFTCHRIWRTDELTNDLYKFDNLIDLVCGVVNSPYHIEEFNRLISEGTHFIVNPNNFPQNLNKDITLGNLFDLKDKTRKLTNKVMSDNGHFV